jgi:hypothetical protein
MHFNAPIDFVKYKVPHYDPAKHERAIIWIHADWSGQSKTLRDKILRLAEENPQLKLSLIELNHDYIDLEWYKKIFNVSFPPHGNGDVLWVLHGNVIAADTNCYLASKIFLQNRLQQITDNHN